MSINNIGKESINKAANVVKERIVKQAVPGGLVRQTPSEATEKAVLEAQASYFKAINAIRNKNLKILEEYGEKNCSGGKTVYEPFTYTPAGERVSRGYTSKEPIGGSYRQIISDKSGNIKEIEYRQPIRKTVIGTKAETVEGDIIYRNYGTDGNFSGTVQHLGANDPIVYSTDSRFQ